MKKIVFMFIALIFMVSFTAFGQSDVPDVVTSSFKQKFPEAKNVTWEIEENGWEAQFKMKDKEMSALFDLVGNWRETETKLKKKDLPESIRNAVEEKFAGFKVTEAQVEEKPGYFVYEIELKKGKREKEVVFDKKGKVLQEKKEEDDD